MTSPIRAVAYGGGVQSTALLVLAATGKIDFPVFLFANTGGGSEDPATLEYLQRFAKPYAAAHGIELERAAEHARQRSGLAVAVQPPSRRSDPRSAANPARARP